jgi:hypothetical protein
MLEKTQHGQGPFDSILHSKSKYDGGKMKALYPSLSDEDLSKLQADTFKYFRDEMYSDTGLIPDSTRQGAPASIAVAGFALTVYPIGVERGYISRSNTMWRQVDLK